MPVNKDMKLDKEQIKECIPHRDPFLFVDEVIELEDKVSIKAKRTFTDKQDFFRGHFPDYPIVPGVILTEALAQTGGILVNYCFKEELKESGFTNAFLMGVNNCKFRKPVLPNQEITLCVELTKRRSRLLFFRGEAFVDGAKVAEADISASLV